VAGDLSPYAYRPGKSPLHRAPAGLKLLALLLISVSAFLFGPPALGAASLAVIGGAVLAGIRPWELLRGLKPLLIMVLLVALCRSLAFDPPAFKVSGLMEGLVFGWLILLSFAAGSLLFSVTTTMELRASLDRGESLLCHPLLRLLRRMSPGPGDGSAPSRIRRITIRRITIRRLIHRLERPRLSLGISLMLGFLPRFFEIWEAADTAYRARGGKKGLGQMRTLVPLVTERMLETAAETAQALESRGLDL
jgi:biotin transport system permease protein